MNNPTPSEKQGKTTSSPDALLVLKEKDDVVVVILEFLDFPTLLRIRRVCYYWKLLIGQRSIPQLIGCKKFTTREELYHKIREYCSPNNHNKCQYADALARNYGWPIGKWDVSEITNFNGVFEDIYYFNEDINDWDMSRATNLSCMFYGASSFHQSLSKWNTSNVKTMAHMFRDAKSFNGDISTWDTSRVTSMHRMFWRAKSFHQDISSWNVSSISYPSGDMFCGSTAFNPDHAPRF